MKINITLNDLLKVNFVTDDVTMKAHLLSKFFKV